MDKDDRRSLIPFRDLCELYPLESASDVLVGCFDRHQDQEGLLFRRCAFETLRRIGGSVELKIIKRVQALEADQALREQMIRVTKGAAAPVK